MGQKWSKKDTVAICSMQSSQFVDDGLLLLFFSLLMMLSIVFSFCLFFFLLYLCHYLLFSSMEEILEQTFAKKVSSPNSLQMFLDLVK